ncbi:MAG: hypothetical protein ABIL44_00990 [candidate division WOR-3 bacterium]
MYSPKINSTLVRKLYLLKMSYATIGVKKYMTEIVEEAINKHIPEIVDEILKAGGTILMPDELKK